MLKSSRRKSRRKNYRKNYYKHKISQRTIDFILKSCIDSNGLESTPDLAKKIFLSTGEKFQHVLYVDIVINLAIDTED